MTADQYKAVLRELGLSHAAKETAEALGLSLRQAQRIARGECPVPRTVALLLAIYQDFAAAESSAPDTKA